MSSAQVSTQLASMSPAQQQHLVQTFPQQVGNTDGVPWNIRTNANTINISDAVISEQQRLNRSKDAKLADYVRATYPDLGENQTRNTLENLRANPELVQRAIGEMDQASSDKISHYNGLLDQVKDPTLTSDFKPTVENDGMIDRQILAFDPSGNGTSVELIGNIDKADNVGVLVPGMNTTLLGSQTNVDAATEFVAHSGGDVAMITYVGGKFPQGELNAASDQFAQNMAPDLVSFSEDVNRTVDATGRDISVTYIGHSYGGSIVGTADHMSLTADRVLFVEAAGAGSGVQEPSDWHNTNPDVERYSMTAPGDLIEAAQGTWFDYGPHGADPDEMPGVTRLDTGYYHESNDSGTIQEGNLVAGVSSHGGVLDYKSDAWDNIFGVISGGDVTLHNDRDVIFPGTIFSDTPPIVLDENETERYQVGQ